MSVCMHTIQQTIAVRLLFKTRNKKKIKENKIKKCIYIYIYIYTYETPWHATVLKFGVRKNIFICFLKDVSYYNCLIKTYIQIYIF